MFTVNETFMSETETRRSYIQNVRDETRLRHFKNRSRDRDVETETASLLIPLVICVRLFLQLNVRCS